MNVLWIGDSITEGMTPTLKTLLGKLGWAGAIFGKVGWSTVRWLRYGNLNALFNRYHPDLVVLALGTNDENTAEFREAAFALDEGARAVGAKVVWIGSFIDQDINNNLRLWFSGRVADGVSLAEGLPRSADGVHFPVASYPELADRCVDAVRRLTDRIPWWSKLLMVGAFGGLLYAMVKFEPENKLPEELGQLSRRSSRLPLFMRDTKAAVLWAREQDAEADDIMLQDRVESYLARAREISARGYATVYRAVRVPAVNGIHNINWDCLGKAWSAVPEGADVYGEAAEASSDLRDVVLRGIVKAKDIDWEYGFASFITYGPDQWEISLLPESQVTVDEITYRPAGQRYSYNQKLEKTRRLQRPIIGSTGSAGESWIKTCKEVQLRRRRLSPVDEAPLGKVSREPVNLSHKDLA